MRVGREGLKARSSFEHRNKLFKHYHNWYEHNELFIRLFLFTTSYFGLEVSQIMFIKCSGKQCDVIEICSKSTLKAFPDYFFKQRFFISRINRVLQSDSHDFTCRGTVIIIKIAVLVQVS